MGQGWLLGRPVAPERVDFAGPPRPDRIPTASPALPGGIALPQEVPAHPGPAR
jgi:hypothetical protein